MNVAIVGGSGLVGRALTRSLLDDGHEVVVLSRDPERRRGSVPPEASIARWQAGDVASMSSSLDGIDAVVCVAGARVAPRPWTRGRKRTILESRVNAIRTVVDAMRQLPAERRPTTLVVVSGIDAYPETPAGADASPWTESSPMGTEFLAQVSRAVESEAQRSEVIGTRVARLRQGHVLARDAELLWFLALPVRLFVGGRLGSGRQWLSWIHVDDTVSLFRRALSDPAVDGVLNATSPGAVHQIDFVRAMARRLHRPIWFPAPTWLVKLVLGEQSALLLGSRRVAPTRALELGHEFRYATIDEAFEDVLG
jgi:uncharacterized protein (TIGR01777 family)